MTPSRLLWTAGMVLLLAAGGGAARAEVRLAGVFGDHMVLQRDVPLRVWGWAEPGEIVHVALQRHRRTVQADRRGRWTVTLPALPASGPHELRARASNEVVLHDVMLGDVWLCGGQSNMEWPLEASSDATAEVAASDLPLVRHIRFPSRARLSPQADTAAARWQVSHPRTSGGFSAVAYHFARRMQQELGVAIGLVNIAVGGSHLETWMRPAAARSDPDLTSIMQAMPPDDASFAAWHLAQGRARAQRWQGALPLTPPANLEDWADPGLDDQDWPELTAPGVWEDQGLAGFDGTLWYRRHLVLSAAQADGSARLQLGMVDDCDDTWVNGERVGGRCGWDTPRVHALPAGLLREGRNVVAVRVHDTGGGGGFHGAADAMHLDTAAGSVPLQGPWKARIESPLAKSAPDANDLPSLLFNGMLQPLLPLRLRGVLWYQGESNVPRAQAYAGAFQRLISDWRQQFGQPRLPFLFVQLAAFRPLASNSLAGSAWAELRDAQRQALSLPATGMVVTTDVGAADDIHPRDKRTVGERLARQALHRVHGRRSVHDGPVFSTMRRLAKGRVELRFRARADGLVARPVGSALQGFTLAGADRRFVPAHAELRASRIVVWHESVPDPQAVRYGWVDNPSAGNLVNRSGLPASPFRSDRWPWLTAGQRFMP